MRAGWFARMAFGAVSVLASDPLRFATPASAASYEEARDIFDISFDREQRLTAQVLLSAAGFSSVVPTENLSRGTYEAIKAFEAREGFSTSGLLTTRQMTRLALDAAPSLRLWGFAKVTYPGRAIAIWVPLGLGLTKDQDGASLRFRDAKGRLALEMVSLDDRTLLAEHDRQIAEATRHAATIRRDDFSGGDDWFNLSSTWADGSEHYVRLHQDGTRVTGFALGWRDDVESVEAERIAVIMAGSLRAAMSGEPFVDPPTFVKATAARADDR